MKKILFLLTGVLFMTACGESTTTNDIVDPLTQGKLSVSLTAGDPIIVDNNAKKSASSSKAAQSTDMSKFSLDIKDNTGKIYSYASYTQMPNELPLTAGDYTVSAKNNGLEVGAAFDLPLYAGSSKFKVEVGKTTDVSMVCELKSTGVQVKYTENMLSLLSEIDVTVVSDDSQTLPYNPDETRTGWFSVPSTGSLHINVSALTKATGKPFKFGGLKLSAVKAKELRNVTLDVKTSGDAVVEIKIDKEIIIKDVTVAIPDGEDIVDNNGDNGSWEEDGEDPTPTPQGPVITGASHEGQPFNLDNIIEVDRSDASKVNQLDVLISSSAAGGIEKLLLTIESAPLHDLLVGLLGIDGQIDLANPPTGDDAPMWVEMFIDDLIGLIDPQVPIKGKSSHMFSVGKLMSLLGSVDTTGGVEHKFHLSIVDASGTTNKTLTVKLVY